MGDCSIQLPSSSSKEDLTGRLRNYIKDLGSLDVSLLTDAAKHFFEESTRWRQVDIVVQLSCGDQQIDINLPDGIGNRVMGPIHMQVGDNCDEYEVYRRKDGNRSWHRNVDERYCATPMAFYEPQPGKVVFSEPLDADCTFRLELALWPETFNAIDCIPSSITDKYRDGLISLAIVKAMEIPDQKWTTPKEGYSPKYFASLHAEKAYAALRSAKRYHTSNLSEARPFGDRMSAAARTRSRTHLRWDRRRHGDRF